MSGLESGGEVQTACGPRELRIDPADTGTHQAVSLDEREDLVVGREDNRGEFAEEPQHFRPLCEVAARQLAHDERMSPDLPVLEQGLEASVTVPASTIRSSSACGEGPNAGAADFHPRPRGGARSHA